MLQNPILDCLEKTWAGVIKKQPKQTKTTSVEIQIPEKAINLVDYEKVKDLTLGSQLNKIESKNNELEAQIKAEQLKEQENQKILLEIQQRNGEIKQQIALEETETQRLTEALQTKLKNAYEEEQKLEDHVSKATQATQGLQNQLEEAKLVNTQLLTELQTEKNNHAELKAQLTDAKIKGTELMGSITENNETIEKLKIDLQNTEEKITVLKTEISNLDNTNEILPQQLEEKKQLNRKLKEELAAIAEETESEKGKGKEKEQKMVSEEEALRQAKQAAADTKALVLDQEFFRQLKKSPEYNALVATKRIEAIAERIDPNSTLQSAEKNTQKVLALIKLRLMVEGRDFLNSLPQLVKDKIPKEGLFALNQQDKENFETIYQFIKNHNDDISRSTRHDAYLKFFPGEVTSAKPFAEVKKLFEEQKQYRDATLTEEMPVLKL